MTVQNIWTNDGSGNSNSVVHNKVIFFLFFFSFFSFFFFFFFLFFLFFVIFFWFMITHEINAKSRATAFIIQPNILDGYFNLHIKSFILYRLQVTLGIGIHKPKY